MPACKVQSPTVNPRQHVDERRRLGRLRDEARREAEECAKVASMPIQHAHAAGIDVGDSTHWVCVDATPDGSDTVREFPAHTPGLRQLVAWLRQCGVTTIALEASGVYGHVLFLTLLEAGIETIMTAPQFARQIKGRPKTDKRDCQWIQHLHKHGLLPTVFQPDEATHTLRDYVRQRANLVRLSGQHIQSRRAGTEGARADESDASARRRHGRDRPEDHPRYIGGRARSAQAGRVARSAVQAHARRDRHGAGWPLSSGARA